MRTHVGQVRHHVGDNLEATLLGELKGTADCRHRVAPVGVASDILENGLHANLNPCAPIPDGSRCAR